MSLAKKTLITMFVLAGLFSAVAVFACQQIGYYWWNRVSDGPIASGAYSKCYWKDLCNVVHDRMIWGPKTDAQADQYCISCANGGCVEE